MLLFLEDSFNIINGQYNPEDELGYTIPIKFRLECIIYTCTVLMTLKLMIVRHKKKVFCNR